MKAARIDLSKGINSRIDKAISGHGYCSVMDNVDLRSGSPKPFRFPVYEKDASASTNTCIWRYRGKWYESTNHRDYVGENMSGKDVIFYTEEGQNPKMAVEGTVVDMGVKEPAIAPTVTTGNSTSPSVSIIETDGNFVSGRQISYRVAWQTEDGIQPPSQKVIGTASADGKGFILNWANTPEALNTLIFSGEPDSEKLLTTIAGSSITYTDTGAVEAVGASASDYDDNTPYTYVYTFTRNVEGFVEESGPSDVSLTVDSSTGRQIVFDYNSDGQFTDSITLAASNTTISPTAVAIAGAVQSSQLREVAFTTVTDHGFATGDKVTFGGFIEPDPVYVSVTSVLTTKPLTVRFTTSVDHGFVSGQSVYFTGFDDPLWNGLSFVISSASGTTFYVLGYDEPIGTLGSVGIAPVSAPNDLTGTYEVIADNTDTKKFYVRNIKAPTGAYGTAQLNKTTFDTASPHGAKDGDAVYVTGTNGDGNSTNGVYKVKVVDSNTIWIDLLSTTGASVTNAKFQTNYLTYRNLYRTGNTGGYFLVKQLPMWEVTYTDTLAVENLGEAPTSFYRDNNQDIIFEKPPLGATNICSHYGMKFLISGNNVIWNVPGFPGSYSAQFFQSFDYKPVALASFAQGLIVLCPDAIYRLDGTNPTQITLTKTHAENGCIAAKSVQKTHAGLIYLAKRGLMSFDGMNAQCITDQKLPDNFLIAPSNIGTWGFWMLPSRFSYNYAALTLNDGWAPYDTASILMHNTVPIDGINKAVDSFYWDGRYFMFWNDSRDYGGHTCVTVDLQVQGFPITTIGMQIVDATVDEFEDAWILLKNASTNPILGGSNPPTGTNENNMANIRTYTTDQMIPSVTTGGYISNAGTTIWKFNASNQPMPYLIRTGQNAFGGEYERKSFLDFEIHSNPLADSSSYFRVFIDGSYVCESLITPSEQPNKHRKLNIPRSMSSGYAADVEFSGTMNVRAIEFSFKQKGES